MKLKTERLLQQCRAALLQYSNEQLNTLFLCWLERMVGEEYMDEALDDLCLLLGYGIRSACSNTLYATYTSWWEVEGSADPDGEFECLHEDGVAALQHRLINMPIKQFALISELAYHVCVQDAEAEGQPFSPVGPEWLRILAVWLANGAQEPFFRQTESKEPLPTLPDPPVSPQQLTRQQRKAQRAEQQRALQQRKTQQAEQRRLEQRLVDQAWQRGYLLLLSEVNNQVVTLLRSKCRKNRRPYISVQVAGAEFANICIELSPIRKAYEAEGKLFFSSNAPIPTFAPTDSMHKRLTSFAAQYSTLAAPNPQETFVHSPPGDVFELKQVSLSDIPKVIQDFMALLPEILKQYEIQLEASKVAYLAQQRELEEARKPAWLKTIVRLSKPGQQATCPALAETVVLPASWPSLLSKEQLGAFLTFLKLPASSREIKANLVQHLSPHLKTDKTILAQFFEIFALELAVPPWELETLLGCTTTERKRWTEEEKFPILGHGSFRKAGSDHDYPVYDRRIILSLTKDDIERWRSEHQAMVRERRRVAARAAAANRKAKQQAEQVAHES